MHPIYTPQLAAEHIATLHDRAARWRLAAPLRPSTATRPSWARVRPRLRRSRPATT